MRAPVFTKLRKVSHFTDYVCIGISVKKQPYQYSNRVNYENIHGFHVIHLKPKDGRLYQFGDVLTVDSDDIFDILLSYIPLGRNSLVICNHSLVVIGSSDFTYQLNTKRIALCESEQDGNMFSGDNGDTVSVQSFIVSCPPTIVSFRDESTNRRFTVVDIANYGCKYMSDIYENLSKEDKRLVYNEAELGVSEDNSLTCCALIARFMQKYYSIVTEYKLGGVALTYSSQGMRAFRHRFYDDCILPHADKECRIMEDDCYIGGRVEDRYHGTYKGKCYLLDIRSLYPFLGTKMPFPTKIAYTQNNPDKATVEEWMKTHLIFAHCHINTTEPAYPKRTDGGLVFPIGRFSSFLCGEEFKDAWNTGRIDYVYRLQAYESAPFLSEYSGSMLEVRSRAKGSNDRLAEHIIKCVTNGLWGMFGQSANIWVIDESIIADRPYGGYTKIERDAENKTDYRIIDWKVSRLEYAPFRDNTFIPVSAVMNSYSRHTLWRHMQYAGLHNVLYCCVDGLIVTQEGLDRLEPMISDNPYAYGKYKVSEQSDSCRILGHGIYTIGKKIAMQGIPRSKGIRYVGFWNAIEGQGSLASMPVIEGKQVLAVDYQGKITQALLSPDNDYGETIAPASLDQQILTQTILDPLGTEHHKHSPEWL